ncbi:MAG: class I tRNA ligase family protein, partial [Actinomycetota bacterium]
MTELPKAYDPPAVEPDLYEDWRAAGLFHAEPDDDGEPFSIVIPPPNVTGSLHVGHALDNTIQDAIVRRERMLGKNAVWIPGTDHAGIATQNVVERQLAAEGTDRHALGREAFLERVWAFREESGGTILKQLRHLGASADWDREVFTFDEPRSRAVREVFVSLHEQGLIYRGNRLINWCPRCNTALSDIEVEHDDVVGELATFRYPLVDGAPGEAVEVATTRAETMLGDTAIAVHPGDARYTALVGRRVRHPFQDRTIPIVADAYVDPEFGSGAVKITPAHDPNDHEIGLRHDLEVIDIFDDRAVLTDVVGERFAGMDRFEARQAVKDALAELDLLVGVDAHEHAVGHCSRCGTTVEPRLSLQWFVAMRRLADRAAQAIRDGRTVFVPESRTKP